MATINMERVNELVRQSARRIAEQEGLNLATTVLYAGLPDNDMLTVTAIIATGENASQKHWQEFHLPGSVLRLDEAALVRLIDSHLEYVARLYHRRVD